MRRDTERNRRLGYDIVLAVLSAILIAGPWRNTGWGDAGDPPAKAPIPSKAEQAKAKALILDIFKEDLVNAKDAVAKVKLAAYFLQQGRESKDDPGNRYMLYMDARQLAATAGNAPLALAAVEELARSFDINLVEMKAATLAVAAAHVESKEAGKALVDLVLPKSLPLVTALSRVLAREKNRKFSKTALRPRAMDTLMAEAAPVLSPKLKRTVLSMSSAADLQKYLKLAQLPAASSFFYETPESVCLPDDRQQAMDTADEPWNINCQLIITFQDESQALGTGWFYGPRLVVTAGHCVHEGEGGNFFKSVEVIPAMNGTIRPFGSLHSTNFRASDGWKTNGTPAVDYGAILLPQEFKTALGKSPGRLPALILSDSELAARPLTISGYPADKAFGTQWYDSGPVESALPARLVYSIDTYGGHSGSSVVSTIKGQLFALGIHNYGGCPNRCTRITSAVKSDLDGWLAESNGQ